MPAQSLESLDRAAVRDITAAMVAAAQSVAAQYGVTIAAAGGNFSPESATVKFSVKIAGADPMAAERKAFERYATAYGLTASDFGRKFVSQGQAYTIAGLKPSSRHYPVIGRRCADGKLFKFSPMAGLHFVTSDEAAPVAPTTRPATIADVPALSAGQKAAATRRRNAMGGK